MVLTPDPEESTQRHKPQVSRSGKGGGAAFTAGRRSGLETRRAGTDCDEPRVQAADAAALAVLVVECAGRASGDQRNVRDEGEEAQGDRPGCGSGAFRGAAACNVTGYEAGKREERWDTKPENDRAHEPESTEHDGNDRDRVALHWLNGRVGCRLAAHSNGQLPVFENCTCVPVLFTWARK